MSDSSKSSRNILKDVWGLRDLGREIENLDINRPFTSDDVWYLINQFPFLKILDIKASKEQLNELPEPKLVRSESGWLMYDYGFCIASSQGEMLYGHALEGEEDEGGEEVGVLNPGKGTVVKQAFDTASDMVALGKSNDWEGVYILEGTDLMGWAAWVVSEELGLKTKGFEPTTEEKKRRDRLKRGGQLDTVGPKLGLY
jgi:hypothetical protein